MYDVNILVNGSRCKQYNHNGKIFIEAKEGSEYTIEIKNNTWKRILAVCSVDGLDILNGKAATENGPGYVINSLNSSKFDGFRVSDEKVAKFVFSYKGESYAASKENGSEKNVGVIGIRLFSEKEKSAPTVIREEHHHHYPKYPKHPYDPWDTGNPPWIYPSYPSIWCDATYSTSIAAGNLNDSGDSFFGGNLTNSSNNSLGNISGQMKCSTDSEHSFKGSNKIKAQFMNCSTTPTRGFDMGTKWGKAKESRVVEVEFERGILVLNTNIYYASRQSLLEMGVPLGNEKQVSFPEPFVHSKYANPPKDWKA